MSGKKRKENYEPVIKGLQIDVSRTEIEKELQARLERKQSRIDKLENLVDQQIAQQGERVSREKWEREEQELLNRASIDATPTGGGKVKLDAPTRGFNSAQEMIDDLYDRKESTNEKEAKRAEYNIQNLWTLTKPGLLQLMREGFSISACPRCEHGILEETTICANCGFNLKETGYLDYGEMWNR